MLCPYWKTLYKAIEDEDTDNSNLGGNEEILINDGNLIKNMKNKERNDDINNEDFEKQKFVKIMKKLSNYTKERYLKILINVIRKY